MAAMTRAGELRWEARGRSLIAIDPIEVCHWHSIEVRQGHGLKIELTATDEEGGPTFRATKITGLTFGGWQIQVLAEAIAAQFAEARFIPQTLDAIEDTD